MTTSCEHENRGGVDVVILRAGDTLAEIVPAFGNNCWVFRVGDYDVLERLEWDAFSAKPTSYGIPILLPFPNRIRDQKFTWKGAEYPVDVAQHGWARSRPWTIASEGCDDASAWVSATFDAADYPDAILKQWPWPFHATVTWRLSDGRLDMVTAVANDASEPMPFGFGIHPYFHKPARATVTVPALKRWALSGNLPTGETVPVEGAYDLKSHADVAPLTLDDIYTELRAEEGAVRCELTDLDDRATTAIEFTRAEFPDVVVYTPPKRPSICIEPNTCPTDAFNLEARGIPASVRVLEPGAEQTFSIRFTRTPAGPTSGS